MFPCLRTAQPEQLETGGKWKKKLNVFNSRTEYRRELKFGEPGVKIQNKKFV